MREEKSNKQPCYTLKIRGGCDTYMKRDGTIGTAGKGALIQTEISATLGVTQDQYLFTPRPKAYGLDQYNQSLVEEKSPPLQSARGGGYNTKSYESGTCVTNL